MTSAEPRPDRREAGGSGTPVPARDQRDRLRAVLAPVIEQAGFDLEDISVIGAGRRSVVRVVVDSDDGVDLDAVALVSRAVSDVLDDDTAGDLIPGAYQLEVTSPGVDRPLTAPRHWRRAIDRLVEVEVGGAKVTGRVLSADTVGVVLAVDGADRPLTWAELGPGRVQIEFSRDSGGDSKTRARTGEG
jgi:ribosome maturation factor RimP